MIEKKFTPKRTICKVTFRLPADIASEEVILAGDFNDWSTKSNKLEKKGDHWETTLRLAPSTEYRFRYLLDGERWANDEGADGYAPNPFGSEDCILKIES